MFRSRRKAGADRSRRDIFAPKVAPSRVRESGGQRMRDGVGT